MNRNNITDSNNLFYGAGSLPAWADSATSINADPLFIDPTSPARNFHLQTGSPAIDAGTAVSVSRDFDGIIRPQGIAFDIGAFEYNQNTLLPPSDTTPPSDIAPPAAPTGLMVN